MLSSGYIALSYKPRILPQGHVSWPWLAKGSDYFR